MTAGFRQLDPRHRGHLVIPGALALLVAAGLWSAHHTERAGHIVTGMSNQVVWGVPHVFAVMLIVAASGALNVASLSSVFNRAEYAGLSRLAVALATGLLIGGLSILVLDLGRPDRLVVAMTHYNFKSIFAWNIFLYTGLIALALVYLWTLMEGRLHVHTKPVGMAVFVWRLILTTGTGSIFGFLVAREAYDSAVLAPLFIALSLAQGLAVFVLVLRTLANLGGTVWRDDLVASFRRLLRWFIAAVAYLVVIQHAAGLYATEHHGFEQFVLHDGGIYTALFWLGQLLVGVAWPLWLLRERATENCTRTLLKASGLVVVGGFAQLYVLIIGGQAYPQTLFSNKVIIESSFFDGVVARYTPSFPELALGLGGIAGSLLIVLLAVRVLHLLPTTTSAKPHS